MPHVALVLRGSLGVQMADGSEEVFSEGDVMLLPPGHDAWCVGDQACTAGVDAYTGGGRGDLSITYLIDSKQDRTGAIPLPSTVICLLQDAGGAPLTASVRG